MWLTPQEIQRVKLERLNALNGVYNGNQIHLPQEHINVGSNYKDLLKSQFDKGEIDQDDYHYSLKESSRKVYRTKGSLM